jgi:hypothetical protein
MTGWQADDLSIGIQNRLSPNMSAAAPEESPTKIEAQRQSA